LDAQKPRKAVYQGSERIKIYYTYAYCSVAQSGLERRIQILTYSNV